MGLKRQNQTRSNSTLTAVERLVKPVKKSEEDTLHDVCVKLGLPKFLQSELVFLRDYIQAMAPLANALNILLPLDLLTELRDQFILFRGLPVPNRPTDLHYQASQRDLTS